MSVVTGQSSCLRYSMIFWSMSEGIENLLLASRKQVSQKRLMAGHRIDRSSFLGGRHATAAIVCPNGAIAAAEAADNADCRNRGRDRRSWDHRWPEPARKPTERTLDR